jgi:imidazolonepropionase
MPKIILIRGARQLLTLRGASGPRRGADLGNLGLIQDGAVLIADGVIREVGPSRRIENLALSRGAEEIDASGSVVMPGFVDCLTHLAAGPARLADYEMRLGGAIGRQIEQAGGGALGLARSIQELSFRALERFAMRAAEDAVRHGTTALEARSGFGLSEPGEMKALRVHAALQRRCAPMAVVSTMLCARGAPGFEDRPDEYLDWMRLHWLPTIKRRKLAAFAAIRCGEGGFGAEQAEGYLRAARDLKYGLRVDAGQGSASAAIGLAAELNVSSVDHAGDLSEQDLARLAQSSSISTLLPGAEFHLGTRHYVSARRLIDAGVAVALASGYHPESCPSLNMQMIVALACSGMHMTPAEAIAAATINSAHALGLASRIGSLEAGKSADLLVLSVSDYREIPYRFGVNLVDLVMVGGEILMRRSEVEWPAN